VSPERGGEDRREQELREEFELCQTGKGRKEGGSSLKCQMFIGGLKRTSGH